MKSRTLDLLVCPICHGGLESICFNPSANLCKKGILHCKICSKNYNIVDGIPHFIKPDQLKGLNRRFSRLYDRFSWVYRAFSTLAFTFIGMDEEVGRREITDRLEPHGGKVLEVSIGPGVNLPYLIPRPDVGEVIGLDISIGQLKRCQSFTRKKGWNVDLFLANAEQLPFRDDSFSGVLHVGGINFFDDKQAAVNEMIRVATPGSRILIADENERGAQGYEKFLPGFKHSFEGNRKTVQPPIDLVPAEMLDTRLVNVWKGWFYCLEFRKPEV